jgi:hypothetical protein
VATPIIADLTTEAGHDASVKTIDIRQPEVDFQAGHDLGELEAVSKGRILLRDVS